MLQTLTPATSRPRTKKNIMTLGLERKIASSSSTTSKVADRNGSNRESPILPSKPKTLLSCKCSELKHSSLAVLHSVQLLLTNYGEILVLKKGGDKSHSRTVLRRHDLCTECFMEHPILPSALMVEIPDTLLRYVYQLDKERTLRQWLDKIAACKPQSLDTSQDEADSYAGNGLIKNHSTVSATSLHGQKPSPPKKPSEDFVNSSSVPPSPLAVSEGSFSPTNSSYTHGPCSPEPQLRSLSAIGHFSSDFKVVSLDGGNLHNASSTSIPMSVMASTDGSSADASFLVQVTEPSDFSAIAREGLQSGTLAGDHEGTIEHGYSAKEQTLKSDRDAECDDDVASLISDNGALSSPCSLCLSRSSSTRSSSKSVGRGSVRSLNLSILRENIEVPGGTGDLKRVSVSNEYVSSDTSAVERQGRFVRRASEQLVVILKSHSFQDKDQRKRTLTRISSSASELDSMTTSRAALEDILKHHTPPLPPATPTSPLVSPPSSSPTFASTPGDENPDGFAASRFHHTQIRNRKWKQSPRIQQRGSLPVNELHGPLQGVAKDQLMVERYGRSISESPTAIQHKLEMRYLIIIL